MVSTFVKVSLPLANTVNNEVYNQHELPQGDITLPQAPSPKTTSFRGT